jgi:hypothetical protein
MFATCGRIHGRLPHTAYNPFTLKWNVAKRRRKFKVLLLRKRTPPSWQGSKDIT